MEDLQTVIEQYMDSLTDCTQKHAFGFLCYFAKGRVFGMFDGIALTLKFDKPTGDDLLKLQMGQRFQHATNAFGRSWIRVYPEKMESDEVVETLIKQSYDYVIESKE